MNHRAKAYPPDLWPEFGTFPLLERLLPRSPGLLLANAARAIRTGASGYLTKDRAAEERVGAVRTVLKGGRYVSASISGSLSSGKGADGQSP